MILLNCAIHSIKKSKFIKKQEANGLLSSLAIKTSLSKIPLLGNVCFKCNFIKWFDSHHNSSIKWVK